MVHGVVPPFYDSVATKTAISLKEHDQCLGVLRLKFEFPYGQAVLTQAKCLKCKRDDFPKTIEEMKRKIDNVRQSVMYE